LGAQATSDVSNQGFDEEKLKRMAAETGGTYHHSPTAAQLAALYKSFAETTQKEYVITVKSGRASYDGTRRDIQVSVGGSRGGGAYVEQHLLNVQSSPWVALAFVLPLALALAGPLAWRTMHRPAVPPPAPTPAALDDQPSPPLYAGPGIWQPPAPPPVTVCPTCQRPIRPGARFCTHCGTTLMPVSPAPGAAAAVCSRCGRPLRPGARFCSVCGHRSQP
jgi:hypothetical protein